MENMEKLSDSVIQTNNPEGVNVKGLILPEGVKEVVEKQSEGLGATRGGAKDDKKAKQKAQKVLNREEYAVVDGKKIYRSEMVSEIKREVEKRVKLLRRDIEKSSGFWSRFDAKSFQENYSMLRKLYNFLTNFTQNLNMAIVKLQGLYESVVIKKEDPVME